jgi:hypothetical protein
MLTSESVPINTKEGMCHMPIQGILRTMLIWVIIGLLLPCSLVGAVKKLSVAMVTGVKKDLKVVREGKPVKVQVGMDLYEGDMLKTNAGCQALILLGDGSELTLKENTQLTLKAYNEKKKNIFLELGEFFGRFVPQKTKVVLETPKGVAGIEGTELFLKAGKDSSSVTVNNGSVRVGSKKIDSLHMYNFESKRILSTKAMDPLWKTSMKEYGARVAEIMEPMKKLEKKGGRKQNEAELEATSNEIKMAGQELREMVPPPEFENLHGMLISLNENSVEFLQASLEVQKNPLNMKMVTILTEKAQEFSTACDTFAGKAESQRKKWYERIDSFKKTYKSTMNS